MIEFPRKECYTIGFITAEHNAGFSAKAGRKLVAVFIPKAPNPMTGFLLYVPEEDVITLDITVEAGFKLIVSAGLLGGDKKEGVWTAPVKPLRWHWKSIFKKKPREVKPVPNDPRD
jgi:uncharacterized membrane protein